MKFVRNSEKKKLLKDMEMYGIKKLPYLLLEAGKEKVRGFSGTMNKEEFAELEEIARVEIVGLYLIRKEKGGLRLGLDGSMMLKPSRNVIEIDAINEWMKGHDLEVKGNNGLYAVKHRGDFLGWGALKDGKLINYIPKERRIRLN